MVIIGRYEMRVEGILSGNTGQNRQRIDRFKLLIAPPPSPPDPGQGDPDLPQPAPGTPWGAGWPNGFILKDGYKAYIWECDGRDNFHDPRKTNLYFHAEVRAVLPDTLHHPATQVRARSEFNWFLTHFGREWCSDLMRKLMTLNDDFKKDGVLVEELRMRRFHWYLGNGGC